VAESGAHNVATASNAALDQEGACFFHDLGPNSRCRIGQKVVMLPDEEIAREAMSLSFVAKYCDFRYPVVANRRGVVCIYYPAESARMSEDEFRDASERAAAAADAAAAAMGIEP